jgi:tetratricopeptide (TPR) repeat protein
MPAPFLLLALLLSPGPTTPPRLLIAPLIPLKKDGPLPSSSIGNHLADELDADGRTLPIVWGLSDAIFRPAALEGKLGDVPNLPTRNQALDVARRLGANYVFVYRSDRKDGKLNANAELIVDGRSVWKDAKSMNATRGMKDSDEDTAASIARTWVQIMIGDSLKSLTPKKTATTPDATPGQNPPVVTVPTPPPAVTTDIAGLEARIADLIRAGKSDAALALVRDAVDADPLSVAARMCLVRLLATQGNAEAAAEEARRAADMLPEKPELRIDAVRRLIAIGNVREAHDQINELRVRFPQDKPTRRLAAEVALAEDDGEAAIREVEPLLKDGDDPEARLLRGLARARLGGGDGAVADLKAWAAGTTDRTSGYLFALKTLSKMAEKAADGLPSLLQRAAVQPKSGAVRDDLDNAQRQAQARAAAWESLPVPDGGQARHDAWTLAHRMMSLVAADLRSYLGGSEDALTAARIDLGEAKQAMKVAEQKKG